MITWDEKKCQTNRKQHGIDFADCASIFDGATVSNEDFRESYGEMRICSLGLLKESVVMAVWTPRFDSGIHLISVRKATKNETKRFWKTVRY